jgi:hypothetical protein
MNDRLDPLLADWSDSLRLTNALYALYKQYRTRTDSYESQLMELIEPGSLTDNDWKALRRRIEDGQQASDS